MHRRFHDAQVLAAVFLCWFALVLAFTLSLSPVVARSALRPGTKKIVPRDCGSYRFSDFRGCLVYHCSSRPITWTVGRRWVLGEPTGGTRAHTIIATKARALKFMMHGREVYAKSVFSPGLAMRPFLRPSLEENEASIREQLQSAIDEQLSKE